MFGFKGLELRSLVFNVKKKYGDKRIEFSEVKKLWFLFFLLEFWFEMVLF